MANINGVTAKIEYENGSGWTEIPLCTLLGTPTAEISEIDTTNLGITDNHMTNQPGMLDPGSVPFEYIYDAAVYEDLQDFKDGLEAIGWRISSPTGHGQTWTFDAWVKKQELQFTPNERNTVKVEVRVSGNIETAFS